MPNVENLINKANGMKIFNKVDLKSAYQQIELHPNSRYISCFQGIYRYNDYFLVSNQRFCKEPKGQKCY